MKPGIKRLAAVLGILLQIVSMIFTVNLLVNFAVTGWEKVIYTFFGVGIQGAQGIAYIFGWYYIVKGEPGKSIPALTIFGFLFVLSLTGTIGFFAVTNATIDNQAVVSDAGFQALQSEFSGYDRQAQEYQETLASQRAKYESAGPANRQLIERQMAATQEAYNNALAQKSAISDQLQNYQSSSSVGSFYAMLAKFFGTDAQTTKFALFVLYAFALDLTSAMCLGYTVVGDLKRTALGRKEDEAEQDDIPENGIRLDADGRSGVDSRGRRWGVMAEPQQHTLPGLATAQHTATQQASSTHAHVDDELIRQIAAVINETKAKQPAGFRPPAEQPKESEPSTPNPDEVRGVIEWALGRVRPQKYTAPWDQEQREYKRLPSQTDFRKEFPQTVSIGGRVTTLGEYVRDEMKGLPLFFNRMDNPDRPGYRQDLTFIGLTDPDNTTVDTVVNCLYNKGLTSC